VPLWEAFLLQMNEFDRYLELKLRDMLDPVVAVTPPVLDVRGRRKPAIELVGEAVPMGVAEPVAVTVPVAPLPTL